MNEKFFNVAESKSAREIYESNNMLSQSELYEKMQSAIGTDEIFGAKIIDKSSAGLILCFGNELRGFLEERNVDIRRKHSFLQRANIDSFINVTITTQNPDGSFLTSRKSIIYEAHEEHKKNLKPGDIVTAIVTNIFDSHVECDIGCGDIGSLHISQVKDQYIKSLDEYFLKGQEVNLSILNYNEEFSQFELNYEGIRQPTGIKVNTVVTAEITEPFDSSGRKFRCIFPDFDNVQGVVLGIPKCYDVTPGDRLPVSVIAIKQGGLPITKF